MTFRRWLLGSLVVVSAGCEPIQEESPEQEKPPAQVQAEKLAAARGFDPREVSLVEAGNRHELHFQGVPIWGLEAKTAHGVTHLTNARFEPATRVETKPRLTQAQAEAAALAELKDASGRVEEVRLVLVPREERRRRPDAPATGRLNAAHFERVVTDLTLIYRVLLTTGEPGDKRGWMARVDARSGRVLRLDSLEVFQTAKTYRKVTGYGSYSGTVAFSALYDSTTSPPYWLEDTRGNEYQWAYRPEDGRHIIYTDYGSTDASFGNGQLFSPSSGPASANGETAAVDAHYAVNMTWNFYETLLGRSGPGNTGKGMNIRVHYPLDNAFYSAYSSPPTISVGYSAYPSSASTWKTLAVTDIIGHELGHDFFMREVAGLPSNFPQEPSELRGMNEGSGDISGFMAELSRDTVRSGRALLNIDQTPLQTSNLTLGEQAVTGARNLLTPDYDEWFDGIGLQEEHDAGGPFARMFLLLAYGCKADMPPSPWYCDRVPNGFTGVGPLAAARLWARTVEALPMGADYLQTRDIALTVAIAMDGHGGILMRKVAYAFAAINVGSQPENIPPETTLSCQQKEQDIECTGTVTDVDTPAPSDEVPLPAPVLVVDGTQTHTLPGWQFTYRIPGTGLASGNHSIQLKAKDMWGNEATRTVTVSLDKTPPQATLFRTGLPKQPVFIVEASDSSGISAVDFLRGTTLMASVLVPPYEYGFGTSTWADGIYPMVIKVYDRFQNVTVINHSLGVDNTPPAVAMTVDPSGPPFTVTASVSDASPLLRVDFKVDGVAFATYTHTAASYQAQYSPLDPLAHNLHVEVTDAFGNTRVATQAAPRDLKPPDVTFSVSQTATTVTLNGSVSDTCGITYPYSLYVDGTLKAQPTTPDYLLDLGTSVEPGEHTFRAVVQDGCGNTRDFQTTFTKSASQPVITSILRDDTDPKRPKFTVQCTDPDGVHHVEMREGGSVLKSLNAPPYVFTVDTTARPDGSYTLLFHCSDIHGVASDVVERIVTADNTGPSITNFTVYGSGRAYLVQAGSVVDPRGIHSVTLSGGLVTPTFTTTVFQSPYRYQWYIPGTTTIQTELPFNVTARDAWGNESSRGYWCYVNTFSRSNAYLSCRVP